MKALVRNQAQQPINLQNGTIVGAADHPGCEKDVELSDRDRKLFVETGRLAVLTSDVSTSPVTEKEQAPPEDTSSGAGDGAAGKSSKK